MRLAFDLDGTVADMHSALAREARLLFPGIDPDAFPTPRRPPATPQRHLTARRRATIDAVDWPAVVAPAARAVEDGVRPGELVGVARRDRTWGARPPLSPRQGAALELMFVTSRPETRGDTAQVQSYRWLAAQGYETPWIFVVHGSRGKIASAMALDVLVDDRPENCLDVAIDSAARAILVWRGEEGRFRQAPASWASVPCRRSESASTFSNRSTAPARRPMAAASSIGFEAAARPETVSRARRPGQALRRRQPVWDGVIVGSLS